MSLNNPKSLVTEERLHEFYSSILPYLGGMPEMVANKFSKGDLYSTEERLIGQWIDQKPVYQKTVPFTVSTVGSIFTIDSTLTRSYVDNIIEISGDYTQSDGNKQSMNRVPVSSFNGLVAFIDATGLVIGTASNTSKGSGYVNIKYTKTTDSAISIGSDTDYSTEEKIVGTWIDGSPIYQKTFQLSNFTIANTESLIDIVTKSELNMDKLVSYEGVMGWNNADIPYTMPFVMVTSNGTIQVDVFCNEDGKIQLRHYRKSGSTNVVNPIVTLQYTKTT